jgi:hypothetical protein
MKRLIAISVVGWFMLAGTADAQVLGTFRWQLQPYCNAVSVVVTQIGSVYRLEGTEDRCGAGQQSSVTGTAYQNPDGTIGLGFNIVSPGGVSSHVTATITLPSMSGAWTEQGVPSGNFVPLIGPGTGSPKPAR